MKVKDLIKELSNLPEDLDILSIESEDWQFKANWNEIQADYIYSDIDSATILYIKNYD